MAGWFGIAALCVFNVCTLYSVGNIGGHDNPEACEDALAKHFHELPVEATLEADGSVSAACLPLGKLDKYTPDQIMEWLSGNPPGEKS